MGSADDDLLRQENRLLSRLNVLEMAVLSMIAEHRPENETLIQICRLVQGALDGSRAMVVRRRPDDHFDVISVDQVPQELHRAVVDRVATEMHRLDQSGTETALLEFDDPSAHGERMVRYEVVTGLGERPDAALCVSCSSPFPIDQATDAFQHASRLIQIVVGQAESTRNFVETIAAEREVIANRIHDDPVQSITVLSLRLQRLARDVPAEHRDAVLSARTHADNAIERMRHLLFDLHPAFLDEDGLTAAIEVYVEEMLEPMGVTWDVDDRLTHVPGPSMTILAFRLVQEALANIASHAEATTVSITLGDDSDTLTICITDDGNGFDPAIIEPHRPGHLGLSNARYIARRAAGRFDITSAPGAGCTVEIHLPMNARLHAATEGARSELR